MLLLLLLLLVVAVLLLVVVVWHMAWRARAGDVARSNSTWEMIGGGVERVLRKRKKGGKE